MARRRLIRQPPLRERLVALPFDLLLSLNERLELIEWDSYGQTVAVPAGVVCSFLLLICRVYFSRQQRDDSPFNVSSSAFAIPQRRPFFSVVFSTVSGALTFLCILNTVYTFRKRKNYTLLGRALDRTPDTPSAYKVKYSSDIDSESPPASPMAKMLAFAKKIRGDDEQEGEEVWELSAWDPPLFGLWLTSTFSPVHLLYIWYGSLDVAFLLMLAAISFYLHSLIRLFLTQLKDRSILHSEVLGEYGKKLVKPILAVPRRDVAVGTDGDVEIYSPAQNTNFATHDPRESRQRYSLAPTDIKPWRSPLAHRQSSPSLRQRASMNLAMRSDGQESPLFRRSRNSNII